MIIGLLSFSEFSIINVSSYPTCISLNNNPILTDLNPNQYNQGFCYYPFIVNLDRCNGSWNTLDDTTSRICVPNKTEDVNLSVFNLIARVNKSKTLTKHISCECKCKFDGRKCSSNQKWNNDRC